MKYLLDTNVCIRYLNGQSIAIRDKIRSLNPDDIVLCSVVKSELYFGAFKSNRPEKTLSKLEPFLAFFKSLPFDDLAARVYGKIRSELEKDGTPIGPYDLQIASIALANNLILVTHNVREFSRVSGLMIEDWE